MQKTRENFEKRLNEAYNVLLADFFWPKVKDLFEEDFYQNNFILVNGEDLPQKLHEKIKEKLKFFIETQMEEKKLNRVQITQFYLKEFDTEREEFFKKYEEFFNRKKQVE